MMKDVLKALRKERNLTQEQLAERLNISQSSIASWETGSRRPDISLLPVIAEFYGVSVETLLEISPEEKPPEREAINLELIRLIGELSPAESQRVLDFVSGIRSSDRS